MHRIASLVSILLVCALLPSAALAQLSGVYEFDGGGDGTSWDEAANWERVLDPNGLPISGNPATPPDPVTSAHIALPGVIVDGTMPGQTALDVEIGTPDGAGSLSISGGDLTVRDVFVGRDDVGGLNAGALTVSGGELVAGDDLTVGAGSMGAMTMTGGLVTTADDLVINGSSWLDMSGGVIGIGDRLVLDDDANLTLGGGEIVAADDFFFFGDSQVSVNGGLLEAVDKLRFDDDEMRNGRLTINGGIVRSNEFGFVDGMDVLQLRGVVEINGTGVYQVEAPGMGDPASQLSVAAAAALILDGTHFTSTSGPLVASQVIVPEFDGRLNVAFTQIAVPEPAPALLIGLAAFAIALRHRAR